MNKYGLAHEKHDHTPLDVTCGLPKTQGCGAKYICCFFCNTFAKCSKSCPVVWASKPQQPKPAAFLCRNAKTIIEMTWDMVFEHGTDYY